MIDADAVQHVNVKVFVSAGAAVDLSDAIVVFHQWIRDQVCPELLIDVADYRLVHAGPGVLLIGHEANYSFDNRESRLGLLYNRKAPLNGTFQSRLTQAQGAAMAACDRLEREDAFRGKLKFDRNAMEVAINDRLLAPNNHETWQVLKPELDKVFPGFTLERRGEPRELFRVGVTRSAT